MSFGLPYPNVFYIYRVFNFKFPGEYFVVGVDIEQYDSRFPEKYLRGLLKTDKIPVAEKAFRNYLGVVPSSPLGYENFSRLVNEYMELPPFSFPNPSHYVGGRKMVNIIANRWPR